MNIGKCAKILSMTTFIAAITVAVVGSDLASMALENAQNVDNFSKAACATDARTPKTSRDTTLAVGDRLKISFFEKVDLPSAGDPAERNTAAPLAQLHTFYQRMDLSGEYPIEQNGAISFPRLGDFQADGCGLQEFQSNLAAAFGRVMGRSADISVTILERRPIYVLGRVKNPGSYKHAPGMMVLHALALAGGLDAGDGRTSKLIESVRETERLRQQAEDMKRLLARRARLDAERKGLESPKPSTELIALAGEQDAQGFMAAEGALFHIDQLKRGHQQNEIAAAAQAAQSELEALKRKLAQLDVQQKMRTERLAQLEGLMGRGLTTRNGVIAVRSELSDIEARRHDYRLAQAQAEARLKQAQLAMDRFALDCAAKLVEAVAATDNEIARMQTSLSSTEKVAAIIDESSASTAPRRTSLTPSYEIVRQGPNGPTALAAQDTSSLAPGDLLRISLNASRTNDTSTPRRIESRLGQQIGPLTEK